MFPFAGAEIPTTFLPSLFSLKTPVELLFFGEDLEVLKDYSLELLPLIESIGGLTDIQGSLETGSPELKIQFHRQKLAQLGFSISDVSEVLRQRINGTIVSRFQKPDRHRQPVVRGCLLPFSPDFAELSVPGGWS